MTCAMKMLRCFSRKFHFTRKASRPSADVVFFSFNALFNINMSATECTTRSRYTDNSFQLSALVVSCNDVILIRELIRCLS